MLAVAATCLVVALAAPTAGAAGAGSSKAKASQKAKASVTKKRLARDIRAIRTRANSNRRNIAALRTSLTTLGTDLRSAISGGDKTVDDKVNAIVGVVTPILQQLGQGSLDLKAGLEKLAAATTENLLLLKDGLEKAGAGLTSLQSYLGATEYGIGQVVIAQPALAPQAGSFVVTPDIPDTVQQAQTTQQFIAQHTGALVVAYGVRSGESDGTGAALPAAHCKVTVTNESKGAGDANTVNQSTETTAANPGLGGLPFQPVNTKSALTSTTPANAGFPFGLKTNNDEEDADVTQNFVSGVVVATGDTYTVGLSCVDTSPDADDPTA
jgi:hypothetical protein